MGFTNEQQAALDAKGRVIVSASAGSGKTTVMIEKIIRLIRDENVGVDEILAVTFTKKAASQMKEKLSRELIKNVNDPDITAENRKRLKTQLSMVSAADISTIHSFCSKLIRSYFYAADVDSSFRVISSEDADGVALKSEALDELLDEGYENDDEDFAHLLSVYWRKKSDKVLREIFTDLYEKLRIRADYKEYLRSSANYNEETFKSIANDLHGYFLEKCAYYYDLVQDEKYYFEQVCAKAKGQREICAQLCEWLESLLATKSYFEILTCGKPAFSRNVGGKNDDATKKEHMARLGFLKDRIVDAYEEETKRLLPYQEELDKFLRSGRTAAALSKYLLIFDERYAAKKREKGVLDYNDLEHIAFGLLSNEEIADSLRKKYRYVFVDEYQDVNPVQEAIISKISGENLFLVGDVKQSIYGFRGSKSKFFVEKQAAFEGGEGKNLVMSRNFRSADMVLDTVNAQFSLAMTPNVCDVDYARGSVMEKGGGYGKYPGRVEIHFLGEKEKKTAQERGVYSVREHTAQKDVESNQAAKMIMKVIQDERMKRFYDTEGDYEKEEERYRNVRYSDIAILSRKKQGQIAKTVAALSAAGLPVTAAAAINVCDYAEVKTLIDILSLIDNAKQDVPLCSALLSTMGGLTTDDLTEIRLAYPQEDFFRSACKCYAAEKKDNLALKLRAFYEYYEKVRKLASVLTAGEILTLILAETRMEAHLLSQENGSFCLRRIRRFIDETNNPEPLSVHEFLVRLKDLDYKIEYSENGGEDSVKVMTMHSSKGLEFPVVILDDLSASFHGVDHDEVVAEETYGIAPRAFDEGKMLKSTTLLRRLYEVKEKASSVADGLNLYYVALTRAKYALHMIFTKQEAMSDVKYAKSYADMTNFSVWSQYIVEDTLFDLEKQERTALVFRPDEALAGRIQTAFKYRYPFAGLEDLSVKSSASKLLSLQKAEREGADESMDEALDVGFGKVVKDDEGSENKSVERNALGTAYHAFLEYFDFSLLYDAAGNPVDKESLKERVSAAVAAFAAKDAAQADLLKVEKLVDILSNPVFYTLQDARLYKEQEFLVNLPMKDVYALVGRDLSDVEKTDDCVIFQGAIDLLAVGEEVRIIDYKYSTHDAEYLQNHYKTQLQLYRMVVAKILKIDEKQIRCILVNIDKGFELEIV